jgi:hypothetical protein
MAKTILVSHAPEAGQVADRVLRADGRVVMNSGFRIFEPLGLDTGHRSGIWALL